MENDNYKILELKDVVKVYGQDTPLPVTALKGVSLSFRKKEFVAILGQSGCGKTTMLNIIGGLDNYTEGDLIIEGVSTKNYTDRDWDSYRNHSIGFVFQSYNLIPHQTVIKNVELALTLSGVDKQTRREKAYKALERVGLKDHVNKLPNQLSGGQMQRVAIARAIVNDPEIILADEPTGALDSETSVQIMDLLKELSQTKLVIMVTHNGELAKTYATRIVTLSDGLLTGDSKPVTKEEEKATAKPKLNKDTKKPSMSLLTAFSLSLNNLVTKKARTILTSIAGSIGIIGIALILSLSAGFNAYINTVQRDTLSNYPITITSTTVNYSSFLGTFMGMNERDEGLEKFTDEQVVSRQDVIADMLQNVIGSIGTNDLVSFKKYLDGQKDLDSYVSAISYTYNLHLHFYKAQEDKNANYRKIYPMKLPTIDKVVAPAQLSSNLSFLKEYYKNFEMMIESPAGVSEMIDNQKLLSEQYDVLKGHWPENANEVVIVVDEYNQISDLNLYKIGLLGDYDVAYIFQRMIVDIMEKAQQQTWTEEQKDQMVKANLAQIPDADYSQDGRPDPTYTFDDILNLEYNIALPSQTYEIVDDTHQLVNGDKFPVWGKSSQETINKFLSSADSNKFVTEGGTKVKVSGIVRLKEGVATGSLTSPLCYTKALTDLFITKNFEQPLVKQELKQAENVDKFPALKETLKDGDKELEWSIISQDKYEAEMSKLGIVYKDKPYSIAIYPISFEAKDKVTALIDNYNEQNKGDDTKQIKYTDTVGLMMSSITQIINAITYVLIAFVSISLIVSSIMISVITHISVIERTKEIGVLRSIGASKKDISRVFNAETAIIGFAAGITGIIVTLLLIIPINIIIHSLADLANVAALPVWGGIALVLISVVLTVLAGLIPARKASKKDPVIALRSE